MAHSSLSTTRSARLSEALNASGVDVFLATSAVTMSYLGGGREEGGERLLALLVGKSGKLCLVAPALAATQAKRLGVTDVRPWRDGEDPYALVKALSREWGFEQGVVAIDDETRAAHLIALQAVLPQARFVAGQTVLSELMRAKDEAELATLRTAGAIADGALAPTLAQMRPGMTEQDVATLLIREMKALGGAADFCIVATGAHGAEPHHYTDDTPLKRGDVVVMDYGCVYGGYMSDITRTIVLGGPDEEQSHVYETVYAAHKAARAAVRPGVTAETVDTAAREVIDDAGYGEFFVHRTGHGLGMRVHEEPYICAGNKFQLEPGNVFSIEPGIYLPGRFGVRIENIIAVTQDGHESLNAEPSPVLVSLPWSD